jgi:hypothetical protein
VKKILLALDKNRAIFLFLVDKLLFLESFVNLFVVQSNKIFIKVAICLRESFDETRTLI